MTPRPSFPAARPADTTEAAERREGLCERCDREYPVWFAPNELWNKVIRAHGGDGYGEMPDRDHFLCPLCFLLLAEERGVEHTGFVVSDQTDIHQQHASECYALKEEIAAAARRTEQAEARLQDARFDAKAWENNFLASERRAHDEKARADAALARVADAEASAAAANAAVRDLKQALGFYADPSTYEESSEPDPDRFATGIVAIDKDQGEIARAALVSGAAEGGDE